MEIYVWILAIPIAIMLLILAWGGCIATALLILLFLDTLGIRLPKWLQKITTKFLKTMGD